MKDQIVNRFKSELPADVAEKAIYNFEREIEVSASLNNDLPILAEVKMYVLLDSAFVWCETPEGHKYWRAIYNDLVEK